MGELKLDVKAQRKFQPSSAQLALVAGGDQRLALVQD